MKCKICGAELRKDGDICNKCYAEYVKEEEVKDDIKNNKNVILKLHRKYLPKYQLTRYGDYYVLAIIVILSFLSQKQYLWTFVAIFIMLALLIFVLAWNKRKAINTTCTFFENRIVWKDDDKIKSMDYSNLEDVRYYQNFFQKRFHLADIQFRPLKGNVLTHGFEIKNVPDFEENWEKICEIVNAKKREN